MSGSSPSTSRNDDPSDEPAPRTASAAVDQAWRLQFGDLRRARDTALEAVALAEAAGDRRTLGYAWFQAAYAAVRLGMRDEGVEASARSRAIFEESGDARGLWLVRTIEALCLRFDGEPDAAIRQLVDLAAHPPREASPSDLFVVHVGLSLSYRYIGLLEPALKWHHQAVDTARDSRDPVLIASTLCNLGGYHYDLHNPEEGCTLLEQGLSLASENKADRLTLIVALNLAQSYAALGRHDDALTIAERFLADERLVQVIGAFEPQVPLTLALAYANAGRADDAQRVFEPVRDRLVRNRHEDGRPEVFWSYVDARIALVASDPRRAAQITMSTLSGLDENAVDSPFDLMQLHAVAAAAYETMGDDRRALHHERRRAVIRERLARLAAHAASITHNIRHELDTTRAERDRIMALHVELEREHRRLAELNDALTAQVAENLRLHEELREQNARDALTGLHNRRYLYDRGPRLLEASQLQGVSLSLVMLDLDHFKRLNDRHGHVVGDRVLTALGKLLRESLREGDLVCRVGGEEFALMLPTSTASVAQDRLRTMLAATRRLKPDEGEPPFPSELTFSAGIVEAPRHGTTIDQLMIAADRLLYRAKEAGRARIEVASDGDQARTAADEAKEAIDLG